MSTLSWGLLRLAPLEGMAFHAGHALPLAPADVAVLHRLMSHLGEFVAEALVEQAAGAPALAAVGRLNQVLQASCGGAYGVMHLPGCGFGLALPGLTPRPPGAGPAREASGLPRLRSRVIGREDVARHLIDTLPRARFITLVGAGGIGKTTAAVDAAVRLHGDYADGTRFVDLSYLASGESVPSAVAAALHMPEPGSMGLAEVVGFVRERQMLLVLDNCEHLVAAVAPMCEGVFKAAPRCHMLVTSREPLRCRGEAVLRLQSLSAPQEQGALTAAHALSFPAVELFAERLAERRAGYTLADADASRVATLCRLVDGLPLALEVVAALTDRYGLEELGRRLAQAPLSLRNEDDPLAPPRHRSLETLFGWSHELLAPLERRIFEHLSIFRSSFSLAAAAAVAGEGDAALAVVSATVVALAQKSLVVLEPGEDGPLCHYLETIRVFAFQKLAGSGDLNAVAARHARYLCTHLQVAAARSRMIERAAWLRLYGPLINDVRAALNWSFSAEGEPLLGVQLTVDSAILAPQLSLWDEYWLQHERAVGYIDASGVHPTPQVELPLRNAYALFIGQNRGPVAEMMRNYRMCVTLAEPLGDAAMTAAAMDGIWMGAFLGGDYPQALEHALACRAGTGDGIEQPGQIRTARMLAQTLHPMAQHDAARELAERLLAATASVRRATESAIDPQVSGRVVLAKVHWLQGRPDQAAEVMAEAMRRAQDDTSVSLAQAISWGALPVSLWRGDAELARQLVERLASHCSAFHLPYWGSWAVTFRSALDGVPLPGATEHGGETDFKRLDMLVTTADFAVTPQALARAETGRSPWCAAEVLRAEGERLLRLGQAPAAEALFQRALTQARAQQAMGWELRALISLVRCRGAHSGAARTQLAAACARFGEGRATRDLRTAFALLDAAPQEANPVLSA